MHLSIYLFHAKFFFSVVHKKVLRGLADASLEILQALNDMLALTCNDNGKVNDQDMKDVIENTDALL